MHMSGGREYSAQDFGFKMPPFDFDKLDDPIEFETNQLYDVVYQSQEISQILHSQDWQFNLICGYPGTGKSTILLTFQHIINHEFLKNGFLAVYYHIVSSLLVPDDVLDEKKHLMQLYRNLIGEIWDTLFILLEKTYSKHKDNGEGKAADEIKKIIGKIERHNNWNKVKSFVKKISVKLEIFDKVRVGIGGESNQKDIDCSIDDVVNSIDAIKEITDNKVKKVFILFDDLGEYNKRFFDLVRERKGAGIKVPYVYEFLYVLFNKHCVNIKVASYPEDFPLFLNQNFEPQHIHPIHLDPDFSDEKGYKETIEKFIPLMSNMFLKRIDKFSDKKSDNDEPLCGYYSYESGQNLLMFENEEIIKKIAGFSNFNPRIALRIAKNAFICAVGTPRTDFVSVKKPQTEIFLGKNQLRGIILNYNKGNKEINTAIDSIATQRYQDVKTVFNNNPEGLKIVESFIELLLNNGANYFTVPSISSKDTDSNEFFKLFLDVFRLLEKRCRVLLRYRGMRGAFSEARSVYGLDSLLLYHYLSKTQNRDDLKSLSLELTLMLKQFTERPYNYFKVYDLSYRDIQDLFTTKDDQKTFLKQREDLEKERNEINIKLDDSRISSAEEMKLNSRLGEIRKKLREITTKMELITQPLLSTAVPNGIQGDPNEYGETSQGERIGAAQLYNLGASPQISETSDERISKYETNFMKFFKNYPTNTKEIASSLFGMLKTTLLKSSEITMYPTGSYIRILKQQNWIITIAGIQSGINVFLDLNFYNNQQLFSKYDEFQKIDIEWTWSSQFKSSGCLWMKLRSVEKFTKNNRSIKSIFLKLL
jgi:energy-coupling factor transporter ATP-binding protein EcfA2